RDGGSLHRGAGDPEGGCVVGGDVDRGFTRFFFFQAEDGIRDRNVTGVQTCALPISIGGWEASKDMRPWPPVMPDESKAWGKLPGSRLPSRAKALTIGVREPNSLAEPASARYSR